MGTGVELGRNLKSLLSVNLKCTLIITVATRKNTIVYDKTCFIQNKKEDGNNKWKIDQDQLYLLKNFPSFKGTKGIFNQSFKGKKISYKNSYKTLGTYGLFQNPGEMILLSAENVYKYQNGTSIDLDTIKKIPTTPESGIGLPFGYDPMILEEYFYILMKKFPKYGFPNMSMPFLGNTNICLDLYEFIRNWTLFNIGEPATIFQNTVDEQLSNLNKLIYREFQEMNLDINIEGGEFQNNLVVFIVRYELE